MIQDRTNNTQQFNAYAGSTSRMAELDALGNLTATKDIIVGKLSLASAITLLTGSTNWSPTGTYTGTTITGTYEGQYYRTNSYYYIAYADNDWTRLGRT